MRMRRDYQLGYIRHDSDSMSVGSDTFRGLGAYSFKKKKEKVCFHIPFQRPKSSNQILSYPLAKSRLLC